MQKLAKLQFDNKFDELWGSSREEVFKLEVLGDYPEDHNQLYRDFLTKKKSSKDVTNTLYKEYASEKIPFVWNRVHLVSLPLTDYMKFEICAYEAWRRLGVKIFFQTFDIIEDFMIFDDKALFVNRFDSKGHYLYSEFSEDDNELAGYLEFKKALKDVVLPMEDFVGSYNILVI